MLSLSSGARVLLYKGTVDETGATFVGMNPRDGFASYLFTLDNGKRGGGPNNEWIVINEKHITIIEQDQDFKRKFNIGDHVRKIPGKKDFEGNEEELSGTVSYYIIAGGTDLENKNIDSLAKHLRGNIRKFLVIERDDGISGGAKDGRWYCYEDDMELITIPVFEEIRDKWVHKYKR